jgi:hypothetical protein
MAAPFTIATVSDIPAYAYRNIHSIEEGDLGDILPTRLQTWRDLYFPVLDKDIVAENTSLVWFVPTTQLISSLIATNSVSQMDPIINLINNTVWSLARTGYVVPTAKETAIVAAFNTAWT